MIFTQHYSSSAGNLYTVTANNGKRLIIDPGVTWPKIQKALKYDLSNVVGCLVSHEHADHSKGVKKVLQAGINVYASTGTLQSLSVDNNRHTMRIYTGYWCIPSHVPCSFNYESYKSNHDAEEPYLFVIRSDEEYLLYAIDTSHINQRFEIPFSIIALDCSYDHEILQQRIKDETINETLAKRLLTSHMSSKNCLAYLQNYCDLSKCREIHLLHMSRDNIDKEKTKKDFESKLFMEVKTI